jgi:hypothetical protein
MKLEFAAVGSSVLVAEEIKRAVKSIFYKDIKIEAYTLDDLAVKIDVDLYICATTQMERLCTLVSQQKIVCLELMPSSKFFLSVGRIPQGARVYIWNNHLRYAQIIEKYCQSLGIRDIVFEPLPYDDLSVETVLAKLRQAKYLIGVDCFIDGDLLENEQYAECLSPKIVLIKAQRVAAIHSASRLLWMIAGLMWQTIYTKRCQFEVADVTSDDEANKLFVYAEQAVELIRDSINKAVYNQISPEAASAQPKGITDFGMNLKNSGLKEKLAGIDELQAVLVQMQEKLKLIETSAR